MQRCRDRARRLLAVCSHWRASIFGFTSLSLFVVCSFLFLPFVARSAPPEGRVIETKVIAEQPGNYFGWPTLARRGDGELLLVVSGGREAHVCPFGRVDFLRSRDGGRTWSWPRTLTDSAIDDRDAGVLVTARGTILVTTFTSLAFEPILDRAIEQEHWPEATLRRWLAARDRIGPEERKEQLGEWMLRSTDGGVTWSAPYRCGINSPHGPIQLADGRVLYAGKELWHGEHRIGVAESADDGLSFHWLATIPTRPGDSHEDYHELHAVQAADGTIVVQIRNHNKNNSGETLQSESTDGGKSFSEPRSIGVWGHPSHLTRLKGGRLLMTIGHRRPPLGVQARLSSDHGKSWSEPFIISGDGTSGDLGYPSTGQLDDGSLVTVWYELMNDSSSAVLRQAHWELE